MTGDRWLDWARELQALAQTGLTYNKDPFDVQRYEALRQIAAEIVAAHTAVAPQYVHELFFREAGHATPKVDVRGAVFREDALLFVRERSDGLWTLPGGWADVGESASESVVREVYEESGYRVRAVKLLAAYDRNKHPHPPILHHAYKLFFQCELAGERDISTNLETDDAQFFGEGDLPDLSADRVTPAQVELMWRHYHNPELPTEFD